MSLPRLALEGASGNRRRRPRPAALEPPGNAAVVQGRWQRPRSIQLWAGLTIVGIACLVAVFAPLLATHDPLAQDTLHRTEGVSVQHWLGLDELGRDVYSRLVWGSRITLTTAMLAVGIALPVGLLIGGLAGIMRGWVDAVTMRALDVQLAYPGLLLALILIVTLGASQRSVVIALSFGYIPYFARIVRGAVRREAALDYVLAAEALGRSKWGVLLRHIGPNVIGQALVHASFAVSGAMVAEASLSFLGLGVSPSDPSWGRMLSNGTQIIYMAPRVAIVPIVALSTVILGWFLLGEGSREALDPKRR